ncbi:ABC transporter substrate-binding protein [Mesorhizobium sp. B2-6-2]|uniref:ABC transporter substrate-binding protein n=1 Tax=Mesorhizobium sp. B2-6-2 TaxID=2589915 RepID=UPI0015E2E57B|nr:ABC transporter substrate-binding protein [Mesorhizobium sp. B2-6-2]
MKRVPSTTKGLVAVLTVCALFSWPAFAQNKGGNLISVLRADPKGLVLAFPSAGDTQLVSGKIYEGLLNYSSDLKPMPSLAKAWEVSPDGSTYTFKLQPGVKWSDGEDFTSADVVFSLSEMLPKTNAAAKQALEQVKSVTAPDAQTVVITLKRPVPYFLMVFPRQQMPMMPKHIYEGTDYATNPHNAKPIGTGPFKLQEWQRGSYIRLVRNDSYWNKDRPDLDSITYRIMPDAASRGIALETGDVQVATSLEVSSTDIARFKTNADIEMTPKGWEYYSAQAMVEFNLRKPLLSDARFRQALSYAVDRQFVLDHIWGGLGRIATGPIGASIPYYTPDVPKYDFDVGKAKKLLDDMGLKADSDGMRHDEKGNSVKVSLLVLPGEPYDRLAEYVREAWKGIGVETDLQTTDLGTCYDRLSNWNFDAAVFTLGQLADPGIGSRSYYHSSNIKKGSPFSNVVGYSNPDVDKWYDEAAVEMDPAKRGKLYADIQRELVADAPMIWLLDLDRLTIYHKSVHNLVTDGFGPRGAWDQAYLDQ